MAPCWAARRGARPHRAGQHVVVPHQLDRRWPSGVALLDLGGGNLRGPEVGDRRRHHQHVRRGGVLVHRVAQLLRRADVHHLDAGRIDQSRGVPGDQRDLGAALGGDARHRVTLLARAAVADEPHRVDRLAGAAGGHQELAAGEVVGQRVVAFQQQLGQRGDLLRLGQPAGAAVGAGEPAERGFQHDRPAAPQGGHVVDGGRVLPHLGVHRRGEQHRTSRREQGRGQQVVGAAVRRAGQQIRGGRRHHDQVGLLAELDVRHLRDVVENARCAPAGRRAPRTWPRRRSAARIRWG